MHVILTHEQADLDALAALLGAHLLQENALPVLPRKLNRNARAYINLHGSDLPFIDPRDLPPGPIEAVTLVDTQSMVTLKGASAKTAVRVIDHHIPRPDLPDSWQVTIDQIGATTTLFVEALQETSVPLTIPQATLLLLGIYEDTGSLTYTNTTPRDARAVAYLLEQGASLRLASRYLNPPLSSEQRQLYERLINAAEWHSIHGQNILIACAQAQDMTEEISSVAHKMRDLFDPDALLLLVSTGEGVRLVARSTTDRVNVSEIAALFGGRGHDRAAAALVRAEGANPPPVTEQLAAARERLLQHLPKIIRPAVTIGQIMSGRPRLLAPETPAEEAAQLMQRYGYEGYPVVDEGKVIGLLTRRAVDRAVAHRLNLPAASLMDAGEVTVHPDQPIDHLQRVMGASGWGQVPVVEPRSGQIIGIVTRTDLLKVLATETRQPAPRLNLADRLTSALPPARLRLLKAIARQAGERHCAAYIVGGFVRDLLLERPSYDFDVVVEGDAIALARALTRVYGGVLTSHSRFGTARWDISAIKPAVAAHLGLPVSAATDLPDSLDLISARTEFYERPTALPIVERGSIKLDLHRRDFTINTLALRLDGRHYGELHDYWGGLNDLKRGLVRVLHSISFIDDPTRLLRAVRFEQRFRFQIEARTLQLMREAHDLLNQVSGDRIRHELNLILDEERVEAILRRLAELGILAAIHPDLPHALPAGWNEPPDPAWQVPDRWNGQPLRRLLGYAAWLGPLSPGIVRDISQRLRLPRDIEQIVLAGGELARGLAACVGKTTSEATFYLDRFPLPALLGALHLLQDQPAARALISAYLERWRAIHPTINGDTLRAMGIPTGPHYRVVLEGLRRAWLDGEITTPEQEQALLRRLLREALP